METKIENFILPNGVGHLTILHGEAAKPLPTREPKVVHVSGTIISPLVYAEELKTRNLLDINKALAIIDLNERKIEFQANPQDYYGAVVSGKLVPTPELKALPINEDKLFDLEEFRKLLKSIRVMFDTRDAFDAVMVKLQSFQMNIQTHFSSINTGTGHNAHVIESKLEREFQLDFTLHHPVYVGTERVPIKIEVGVDIQNKTPRFFLFSFDLDKERERVWDQLQKYIYEAFVAISVIVLKK